MCAGLRSKDVDSGCARMTGVGGGDARLGADAQVAVAGVEGEQQRGCVGEGAGWAVADDLEAELDCRGLCGAGLSEGLVEDAPDLPGVEGELLRGGGAEIELHGGGAGDGVDGGSTGDAAGVEGGACVFAGARCEPGKVGQGGNGAAEQDDGIGGAGVGPGVASGAGEGDAEALAAQGAGDDGRGSGAFEGEQGADAAAVGAVLEQVTHAAEVALAFFADVGGEEESERRLDAGETKGGDSSEECGESGSVVAASRAEDAGSFLFGGGVDAGGKDGVEVGGEDDELLMMKIGAGQFAERVAFLIDVDV